jgi:hypothetical protein
VTHQAIDASVAIFAYEDEATARAISAVTVEPTFVADILIGRPDGSFTPIAYVILSQRIFAHFSRPVTH